MRIIILYLFLATPLIFGSELRVSYGKHNSPPFAIIKDNQLVGGLIKDIFDEVGKELEIEIQYVESPRVRQLSQINDGTIHVLSLINPLWIENPDYLDWSPVILEEKNVFLLNISNPINIKSHSDLYGRRLACIKGYYYEGLMDYFESETITRINNTNLESNIKMLKAGRVDAVIDSQILLRYLIKNEKNLIISSYISTTHKRYFAYSKRMEVSKKRLNRAINNLIESGFVEKRMDYYLYDK